MQEAQNEMASSLKARRISLNDVQFAPLALIFFGALGLLDVIFKFNLTPSQRYFLDFSALYGFTTAVHVIFPIWLMERSGDFRELIESNVGPIEPLRRKLLLIFLAFFGFIFGVSYYGSLLLVKTVLLAQALWGVWHYLTQTRGLYQATLLGQSRGLYSHTLTALKILVLVIFACRTLRMSNTSYGLQSWYSLYHASLVLYVLAGALLIYILVRTYQIRTSEKKQFWVLSRFFMWLMTALTPISAYGVHALHGAEYYDLSRKVETQSQKKRTNKVFAISFAVFILLFGALGIFEITRFFEKYRMLSAIILGFSLSVSMTHFILDGWIYKMKNDQSRAIMQRLLR